VDEVRVESWLQLQAELFAGAWHEELGRFRSDFAFRGESDARNDLSTSLARLGGAFADVEGHLLRNFRKYARREAVPEDSLWNWLALAKHHGLPTRLLDWTYSPYVALHFLTASPDRFDLDGAIWCVDFVKANRRLPPPLRELLEEEGSNTFTAELLERAAPTLQELDRLGGDFVVFLEPPSLDDRIVNQAALFSLMPSAHARFDRWLEAHPDLVRRVVVPAELKWEVRDKLDQANLTERVLFPGLDGLSRWLARYYGPRTPTP
jgi:hypothetical protein